MAKSKKIKILISKIITSIVILCVVMLAVLSFMWTKKQETEKIYSQKRSISHLASIIVHDELDKLVDICDAVASRPKVVELTSVEKWDELPGYIYDLPKRFTYIEAVFIADKHGTLKAGVPDFTEIIGKNFAFRDWYRGVSKNWQTYVSEVYKRANQPQYNIIAIAAPIRTKDGTNIAGILVFQIRLDIFGGWDTKLDSGKGGFVYITDQRGRIVYHPKYSAQGKIIDFSSAPLVQKLLKQESGIEIMYDSVDKEKSLTAYEPVDNYGWGIIISQPLKFAFSLRNDELRFFLIAYLLIGCLILIVTYLVNRNISMIRKSEEAMRSANAYNRSLIEASLDPLVTIGPDGKITDVNIATERITGFSRQELIGKEFPEYFTEPQKAREGYKEVFRKGLVFDYPLEIKHKDGHSTPVLYNASVYKNDAGDEVGVFAAARDTTERKRAEKSQHLAQMGQLVAVVAHEVNNPLMIISSAAQLSLMEKLHNKEVVANLNDIIEQCARAKDIIHSFLMFSRPGKGEAKEVDIKDILEEVIKLIEHQFSLDNIKITRNYYRAPLIVKVDNKRMQEVFMNLLRNAKDAISRGGDIVVSTAKEGNFINVEIKDTGAGISEENLKKLFQPFFTTKEVGVGLGVLVCNAIIQAYGGSIRYASKVGVGTAVTIILPLERGA
jgi:PAS domain S-box-containing protein